MSEARERPRWNWFANTLSVFALIISASSFYLTNLYVSHDLRVRVVDFRVCEPNAEAGCERGAMVAKAALTNTGNRQGIVVDATCVMSMDNNTEILSGEPCKTANAAFPLVLEPGSVQVLNFGFPTHTAHRKESKDEAAIKFSLLLNVITANGESRWITDRDFATATIGNEGTSWRLGDKIGMSGGLRPGSTPPTL